MIERMRLVLRVLGADRWMERLREFAGCAVYRDVVSRCKKMCFSADDVYKVAGGRYGYLYGTKAHSVHILPLQEQFSIKGQHCV
jgi:hypothetical protein